MSQATLIFIVSAFSLHAFAQPAPGLPSARIPASPAWPLGPPHSHAGFEGTLARSDGQTLSIELHDQRVIRFRLDERPRYQPDSGPESLTAFHVTDVAAVDSEVDSKGDLIAHSVRFIRKASPNEQAEIFRNPEIMHRWRENLLGGASMDAASDDRRLSLAAKPKAITDAEDDMMPGQPRTDSLASGPGEDHLIPLIRRTINEAFAKLPNFRAKEITSLFHSTAKPIKWIPESVIAAVDLEATEMPAAFPLDRAERSVDFGMMHIGTEELLLPTTAYWFDCFRNSYSCFLNRMDFRDFRRFNATSTVQFGN